MSDGRTAPERAQTEHTTPGRWLYADAEEVELNRRAVVADALALRDAESWSIAETLPLLDLDEARTVLGMLDALTSPDRRLRDALAVGDEVDALWLLSEAVEPAEERLWAALDALDDASLELLVRARDGGW